MQVTKRDSSVQPVDFNKITNRISKLASELSKDIDPIRVAQRVCTSLYDKVNTYELDELSAEIAISLSTEHPDYGTLAAHLCINNLHKQTKESFGDKTQFLFENNCVSRLYYDNVMKHIEQIESVIDYNRDYDFDYFGVKTLIKSYLVSVNKKIVERPQDMWMRVSVGIHGDNIESVIETYNAMSMKKFTHATPTLFNAGTEYPQLSSCYLVELESDSIQGIYNTLSDCAQISKWAGGIGMHVHKLRATGSDIRNVKGACTGIVPSLRVFNATSRYVNQSGHRPGSIAVYLSVEHADIFKFLDLRKNHGDEEERCRDLFYGLWVSDLFMERVKNNEMWSLFCPHNINHALEDIYGDEFVQVYEQLEREKKYVKQVKAQELWFAICRSLFFF